MNTDVALFRWLNGFAGQLPWLDLLMSSVARYAPIVVVVVLLACWARWTPRWQRAAAIAAAAALLTLGVGQLVGLALPRPRPYMIMQATVLVPHAPDTSFPSDHAILLFAVSVVLASVSRRLGTSLALFGLVVLVAPVYIGVHYPSDVLGGAVLGTLGGLATLALCRTPTVDRWIDLVLVQLARVRLAAPPEPADAAVARDGRPLHRAG